MHIYILCHPFGEVHNILYTYYVIHWGRYYVIHSGTYIHIMSSIGGGTYILCHPFGDIHISACHPLIWGRIHNIYYVIHSGMYGLHACHPFGVIMLSIRGYIFITNEQVKLISFI